MEANDNKYNEHYKSGGIQPIDIMCLNFSRDEFIGFCKGNALKYILRAGKKEGEPVDKDLTKALNYIEIWIKYEKSDKLE